LFEVPSNALAGVVNYVTIWPKNNTGRSRFGIDAPDDFSIAFQPSLSESLIFKRFNDCIMIGYKLPITGRLSADASKSLANGIGLCSGRSGDPVIFDVFINGQMGL
jgi:hypothetical protein